MAKPKPESDLDLGRQQPRHAVIHSAQLISQNDIFPCDLINVSAGGAKIACKKEPLTLAPVVTLSVEGYGEIVCKVAWREAAFLGLRFYGRPEDAAKLAEFLIAKPRDSREQRQHTRTSVLWSATVYAGLEVFDCVIQNVSLGGAKLSFKDSYIIPAQFRLVCTHFGDLNVETVWRDGRVVGVRFLDHPDVIRELLWAVLPSNS